MLSSKKKKKDISWNSMLFPMQSLIRHYIFKLLSVQGKRGAKLLNLDCKSFRSKDRQQVTCHTNKSGSTLLVVSLLRTLHRRWPGVVMITRLLVTSRMGNSPVSRLHTWMDLKLLATCVSFFFGKGAVRALLCLHLTNRCSSTRFHLSQTH